MATFEAKGAGTAAAKAATDPCGAQSAEDRQAGFPADDRLRRWQRIVKNGYQPAPDARLDKLLDELLDYLQSPDPARRDAIAYEVFYAWMVDKPRLSNEQLRHVLRVLIARLGAPPSGPDSVYGRSFAALTLSLMVARDLAQPFLSGKERQSLLDAAVAYANSETDLRGHTGGRGWAHAAAHGADLLKFLAREPTFGQDDRRRILDAIAAWVVRPHGALLCYGEDARLAQSALDVLQRGVSPDAIDRWIDTLTGPLKEKAGPGFDQKRYAAQRNGRNLLFSLFVRLSVQKAPSDAMAHTLKGLTALLAP